MDELRAKIGSAAIDSMDNFTGEFLELARPMYSAIHDTSRQLLEQGMDREAAMGTMISMCSSAVLCGLGFIDADA